MRICPRGHKITKETNKELKKEYPYVCLVCNENFYRFETIYRRPKK